jgi:hypothetical protein
VNERKERIKEIEMRAKEELGLLEKEQLSDSMIKGSFLQAATHTSHHISRRQAGTWQTQAGLLVLLIIILIVIGVVLIS